MKIHFNLLFNSCRLLFINFFQPELYRDWDALIVFSAMPRLFPATSQQPDFISCYMSFIRVAVSWVNNGNETHGIPSYSVHDALFFQTRIHEPAWLQIHQISSVCRGNKRKPRWYHFLMIMSLKTWFLFWCINCLFFLGESSSLDNLEYNVRYSLTKWNSDCYGKVITRASLIDVAKI